MTGLNILFFFVGMLVGAFFISMAYSMESRVDKESQLKSGEWKSKRSDASSPPCGDLENVPCADEKLHCAGSSPTEPEEEAPEPEEERISDEELVGEQFYADQGGDE